MQRSAGSAGGVIGCSYSWATLARCKGGCKSRNLWTSRREARASGHHSSFSSAPRQEPGGSAASAHIASSKQCAARNDKESIWVIGWRRDPRGDVLDHIRGDVAGASVFGGRRRSGARDEEMVQRGSNLRTKAANRRHNDPHVTILPPTERGRGRSRFCRRGRAASRAGGRAGNSASRGRTGRSGWHKACRTRPCFSLRACA
jgi:hypothetical protein